MGTRGNEIYLAVAKLLRLVTRKLPHWALQGVAGVLALPLSAYVWLCRYSRLNLPMRDYMLNVLDHLSYADRCITIYDQLNPHYAKYYRRAEVVELMQSAPFVVDVHSRHGYGWTAIAIKPEESGASAGVDPTAVRR